MEKKTEAKQNFYLYAFLINLVAGVFAFAWTIIDQGGLFSLAGDFNVQQIPFAMYANDAIKSGNVIWDYSLDLGSNFLGGQMFYILGNPSFWISLLFPSKYFMYIVGWLYVLKYAVAGLTSYAWMRRYVKDQNFAVIASMLYAFSGFMNEDLLFYHFHDVVALFPLMMLTLDALMLEKKKGPFIFAVCINALVNYFFIIGEVIFLVIYFLLRFLVPDIRRGIRRLGSMFIEGVLGCGLGAVLLLPAFVFTSQNPRVSVDYTGSTALVYDVQRYLYILKGLLFPGEVMSDQSAAIRNNFSSCNAYLPMVGLVLVIAFVTINKKHWITRLLKVSLVMALVPILNASYSLFAGLYCRWYYMPILIMALASALVMDKWYDETEDFMYPTPLQKVIARSALIWGLICVAFICYLVFVPWNTSNESLIFRPDLFAVWSAVSIGGTFLTYLVFCRMGKRRVTTLCLLIYAFAIGTCAGAIFLYQLAHGEDARHIYDRIMTSAEFNVDTEEYRFSNRDNLETLTHGYPASANFCSTVSGSIFRFYKSLGLSRDVKSPDAPDGLNELISAKYTYETEKRKNEDAIQTVQGDYFTYYIYQDQSIAPIGFTYDTYMTASSFAASNTANRAILMLKTLVIPDDREEEVSKVLRKYDATTDGSATKEYLNAISAAHLNECSQNFHRTTSSFGSTITAAKDTYAFYSIPNDSGWSATVNGQKTEIIDINGFMAVPIKAGENDIEFTYKVPGLGAGAAGSAAAAVLIAVYLVIVKKKKRKDALAASSREEFVPSEVIEDPQSSSGEKSTSSS